MFNISLLINYSLVPRVKQKVYEIERKERFSKIQKIVNIGQSPQEVDYNNIKALNKVKMNNSPQKFFEVIPKYKLNQN